MTVHQRARLLRAVVSAVAEKGYQATTITDIVDRARVSRSVMYREFDGKLDCFLAAIDAGRASLTAHLVEAVDAAFDGSLDTAIRAISRTYLATASQEPDHTRAWVLELAAAGPDGVALRARYLDGLATLIGDVDRRCGNRGRRTPEFYVAVVGGLTELVAREVHAGAQAKLPGMEDTMAQIIVAMLR